MIALFNDWPSIQSSPHNGNSDIKTVTLFYGDIHLYLMTSLPVSQRWMVMHASAKSKGH